MADLGTLNRVRADCDQRRKTIRSSYAEQRTGDRWFLSTVRLRLTGATFQIVSRTRELVRNRDLRRELRWLFCQPVSVAGGT